jgi:Gpi18-like mannosyltransferase
MFFAAFLYAWLNSRFAEKKGIGGKMLYYFIAVFMMALCMFIHPVAGFFLLFIMGIYILNKH